VLKQIRIRLVFKPVPAVCPSCAAAAKPSRRKGLDTSGSRPGSSKQPSSKGKPKRRDSMDDFIVDASDSGGDYDDDESGGLRVLGADS
jgi:hypothetical protein